MALGCEVSVRHPACFEIFIGKLYAGFLDKARQIRYNTVFVLFLMHFGRR